MLPPFLQLRTTSTESFYDAVFEHSSPVGAIRALWWSAACVGAVPSTVLLFLPGNPGILDFYTPFLGALHVKDKSGTLAIMAHSHIGHSPELDYQHSRQSTSYSLPAQIQGALEAYDAVRRYYGQAKIVLAGHSVGAWIALQVLKARHADVNAVFLLFPTIAQISKTPNGQKLSPLFVPTVRYVLSALSYCTRILPDALLSMFFVAWPASQISALRRLLGSPQTIWAALTMADHEMQVIKELDIPLLTENDHRLYFYFAEQDDWVGEYRDEILKSLGPEPGSVKVVFGPRDIPHDFCINHGEQLASQCHRWLEKAHIPFVINRNNCDE
ncbi:hypothetical protein APHAL10511_006086 [Amanita phalloides]|nr:hypothetical protein APHAL10511_006086 [Amanita phalloides]